MICFAESVELMCPDVQAVEPVRWQVMEKLLHRLIAQGVTSELACQIVTRVQIDLPDSLVAAAIDDLIIIHADELLHSMVRLRRMIEPLFDTGHSPQLHLMPMTLISMINNLAAQYRITEAR